MSYCLGPHGRQASLSITNFQSLLKLMSIDSVMPSNHLILCSPFFFCFQSYPELGSSPVSQLFASGGLNIRTSASATVLPTDWFDWLIWSPCSPRDSQESSLTPQFKSINSSTLFMVQVSHLYLATGKTIALTMQNFVGKVMSLLFNTLPGSKWLKIDDRFWRTGSNCKDISHHLPSLTVKWIPRSEAML